MRKYVNYHPVLRRFTVRRDATGREFLYGALFLLALAGVLIAIYAKTL